ncbi:glutamate receptor 2.8-like [Magnolia sinica]|uniref:glutamate receptor 2.8-like n=1 Tax=Magnolia sinica TaxID=86752 RepID=UPI0026593670|nr:glutamate receptor 2.8-like [Magnolia sinica]
MLVMGYAASQTSMFMVEKLRSTVKDDWKESSLKSSVFGSSYMRASRNDSSRGLISSDILKNHSVFVEDLVTVFLTEVPAATRGGKNNNTLTIAVSDKNGFHELLLVGTDIPTTADINVNALMEVIQMLPYNVSHGSFQFRNGHKNSHWMRAVIEGGMINKTLRIAVPAKSGFSGFVNQKGDPPSVMGFSMFKEVMKSLPYQVSYIPYEAGHENEDRYNDELIYKLYLKEYDGVVGSITITANRSKFVDFTQPYMMSGISMLVPIEDDDDMKSLWWFLKPMTAEMWVATIALFMLKGILVWIFEHGTNEEFQGTPSQQVGKILCVSFAVFVSAEKEKLQSNYSRFIVSIWTVAVLLLGACYVAIISSILTAEKLQPAATDIESLVEDGKCAGYRKGSLVLEFLKQMGFEESKLKAYTTREEYAEGLLRGGGNNGVSAIVDEIPYLKVFLAKYGHRYAMMGPIHRPSGFGFAFQRGSKIVPHISRAILELTEGDKMFELEQKWFRRCKTSPDPHQTPVVPNKISLHSFRGILLITELTSGVALFIFIILFIYKRKTTRHGNDSSSQTSFVGPRNSREALGNCSIEITANHTNEEDSNVNRERERDLRRPEDGQLDERTTQYGIPSEIICEEDCCTEEC